MKTQVKKQGDTVIVYIDGKLNFEIQEPLRANLNDLVSRSRTDEVPKKIIFNLKNLEFVGSSGISNFVQTLKEINQKSPIKPRLCNVKSEFQKIINAFDEEDELQIYDSEERAKKSFDQ